MAILLLESLHIIFLDFTVFESDQQISQRLWVQIKGHSNSFKLEDLVFELLSRHLAFILLPKAKETALGDLLLGMPHYLIAHQTQREKCLLIG